MSRTGGVYYCGRTMWRGRRSWGDVAGVGSIFAFAFAYLSPAVKDGGSFGTFDLVLGVTSLGTGLYPPPPWNRENSDAVSQMAAWNAYDWRQIHAGHFPLWNDLTLLGLPHFLNFQSAVLSLPDLVSYLAPLHLAFLVAVATKLVLAGTGAYVLSRVIGLGPPASAFAGVTFMLSGGFANWVSWPLADVMAWTGWLAALAVLVYRHPGKARYVVLLAVATAFFVYGGHPETNVIVAFGLLVLVIGAVVAARAARRKISLPGVARVGGGTLAGLLLSAPLWFPGLQILQAAHRAYRGDLPTIPDKGLIQTVAAGYFGLPTTSLSFQIPALNYYEAVGYVGVIALVLAVVAVVRWWRRPIVVGITCLALAEILVSYKIGPVTPVQRVFTDMGLGSIEWLRGRLILGLPVGLLGAVGLETLFKAPDRHRRSVLVAFCAATAALGLLVIGLWVNAEVATKGAVQSAQEQSLIWPTVMVGACLAAAAVLVTRQQRTLVAGTLFTLGATNCAFLVFAGVGVNTYSTRFYPQSPAISQLLAKVGTGLVGLDDGNPALFQGSPHVGLYPEANVAYQLAQFDGHDPVLPNSYFATLGAGQDTSQVPPLITPSIGSAAAARTYGIQWVLASRHVPPPTGTVYVMTVAGERLYSVPGATRFSFLPGSPGDGAALVRSVSHPTSSEYDVVVSTARAATLVIRVTDTPGWHARVDGQAVPISSYGGVMMSIKVPAGAHEVVIQYFPGRLKIGVVMAGLGVVLLAGYAVGLLVLARRRNGRVATATAAPDEQIEDFSLGMASP